MTAGDLNETVTIQTRSKTRDKMGGESYQWGDLYTMKATVSTKGGGQQSANGAIFSTSTIRVITWYRHDVKSQQRLKYDGLCYTIEAVSRSRKRNMMELTCELNNE